MSQSFSFPPPPPPPPRREDHSNNIRGGFRGRGDSRGHFNRGGRQQSRGRGFHNYQGPHRGRGDYGQKPVASKRDFSTAFASQTQARPKAPPAVPSFNIDIESLLPKKSSEPAAEPGKRKNNLLGLTPAVQNTSDSEDDADEEGKLAAASAGDAIEFEHNGRTLTLRTPGEIAAWIAERKRRFPTKAKAEAAKREAEEKKRQWEERKRAREESLRLEREARERVRSERERQRLKEKLLAAHIAKAKSAVAESKEDTALKARQRAEKLKRKAERAARELQVAEEQLRQSEQADNTFEIKSDPTGHAENIPMIPANMSDDLVPDDTSSSGSSDMDTGSESGSEPEETTSKSKDVEQVAPSSQTPRKRNADPIPLCKSMAKYGRCKFGRKCRYSHKVQKEKREKPSIGMIRRKGLYQTMVEKEEEQDMKRALRAIIALGERGILNPPEQNDEVTNNLEASTSLTDS